MRDRDPRTRRWRRNLAGGFVVSLLAHVVLLLAFEADPPPGESTGDVGSEADRERTAWEADVLRVVRVRERAPAPAPEAAAPAPASSEASGAPGPPALPASLADAALGSDAAGEALARFASAGRVSAARAVADSVGRGSRPSRGARPEQSVPPATYDGRGEFRATSRAAKEASRSGRSPDLGGDAVAVSDRGRIAGPPDGRAGFGGGASGGGTCGVPAAINRLWDGGLIVGR